MDVRELRGHFGVVLQDPVVFDGTLAYNIAYGAPHAGRDEVERAARAAEINELAMSLPDGFDTLIGSEGVKLSVGEKQRVSIARAILKEPAILVMDEATSALDSHSEALIQKALERVLKGRTSFVIAHRLSTITSADLIVVMDKGTVVERGNHGELMRIEGGLYSRLYKELLGEVRGVVPA
jgi:ABC-type multidrug transport system fused ATPase/permease subunit